jgi:hypothetical protein
MTLRQLQRSRIYAVWFGPGIERELDMAIPSPPWHTKTFPLTDRGGGTSRSAPTTVRRHLENIYDKLGVHTRTAAATRLLGILNDLR